MTQESLAYAQKLARRGWPDLAAVVYEDVLAHQPPPRGVGEILLRLGRLYFETAAYDKSEQCFKRILAAHPTGARRVEALYWAGESAYAAKKYGDALRCFQQCMAAAGDDRSPIFVHAKYGAGWCLFQLGRYEEAIEQFKAFSDKYFYYKLAAEAQLALGRAYARLERYDEACDAFRLAAKEASKPEVQAQALLAIGEARFAQQRYGEAQAALDAVLKKFSRSRAAPAARWRLAQIYEQWDQRVKAMKAYRELARLYPRTEFGRRAVLKLGEALKNVSPEEAARMGLGEDNLFGLAEAAFREGRLADAAAAYEQQLRRFPRGVRAAEAQFKLGLCLLNKKDYEAAAPRFLAALEANPSEALWIQAAYRAAHCAYKLKQFDRARRLAASVLARRAPRDLAARARFLLGECQFQAKEFADAAESYRLALRPPAPAELVEEAMFRRALSLYRSGRDAEAAAAASEFRNRFPASGQASEALYVQADSERLAGRVKDAMEHFADYAERPDARSRAAALFELARLLEKAGRREDALEGYRRARAAAQRARDRRVGALAEERIAWMLYAAGRRQEAADAFLALVRRWPDRRLSAETYNWLGLRLFRAGRPADARRAFEGLITHWAGDKSKAALVEQAYYWLAKCHEAAGDEAARVSTLKALLAAFPHSRFAPLAKLAAADYYMAAGRPAQADPLYRDAASSAAGALQAEALCKLGEALLKEDKPKEALAPLAKVAIVFDAPATRGWALRASVAAGRACELLGKLDQAREFYRAAADAADAPADAARWRSEARRRLRRLAERKGGRP